MAKFPTYEQMAKDVAEKALDEILYDGKSIREWMKIIVEQEPKGKWIKIQSGDKNFPESIVCSRCKNENSHFDFDEHSEPIGKIFVTSKYCPNCGVKMEVEHETD